MATRNLVPIPLTDDDRTSASSEFPPPSAQGGRASMLACAVRPAFGEIRNALTPFKASVDAARLAAAEVSVFARPSIPTSDDAADAASVQAKDELRDALSDLDGIFERVMDQLGALERALLVEGTGTSLKEVVDVADRLAHHHTKLVGGVILPEAIPRVSISAPTTDAGVLLAAALSTLGSELRREQGGGLRINVDEEETQVRVSIVAPRQSLAVARAAHSLAPTGPGEKSEFSVDGDALVVFFDRAV